MRAATLSSKFQITIPTYARKALGLKAGRGLRIVVKEDRIELYPEESITALRGLFQGQSADVPREDDRV
jgi:AbrB family looped-hinge helix DNA binding protein